MFSIAQILNLHALAIRHDELAVLVELDWRVGITNLHVEDDLLSLHALLEFTHALHELVVACDSENRGLSIKFRKLLRMFT